MNTYDKELKNTYNHKCPLIMLDYLKLKAENSYMDDLLNNNCDEYERLVDDISDCKEIRINQRDFKIIEITNEDI